MICLWCDKGLTEEEAERSNLCSDCQQVSTGIPGLSSEQLDKLPFGVIQLNKRGEIVSFNSAEQRLSRRTEDVTGKNFFSEIAPCADVKEFRGRFDAFLNGNNLSELFNFTYHFRDYTVEVQITFLRVNEQLAFVLSKRTER
jgi:photoactive yellow protein